MALSEFITQHQEAILSECEAFAQTLLPAAASMDKAALRDHAAQVLAAIALDMKQPQTGRAQRAKSHGRGPAPSSDNPTAAALHGELRAAAGFDVNQTTAEFRSLRASVIRLWFESKPQLGRDEVFELVRFNEAMDQALAESILYFAAEAAHMRTLFLGVLSHELRTPLATIMASGQSLVLAQRLQRPVPEAADRVLRAGKRIESLLDDLLDFVRSGLGEGMRVAPVPLDLGKVCERVVGELQSVYPERAITLARSGDMACTCDEQRIAQALSNLVGNAVKYGRPDKPVEVTVVGVDEVELVISVANKGAVISAETRDSLFEPLVRGAGGDHFGVNLGLGLYIVKEIATAHGGSVAVDSSAEGGTAFRIRLPRHANEAEVSAFGGLKLN
ncbi:sensor histidine kinase [Ideonella sp. BN130291]|uniref:sensor histidine kinase n=1 Tax=Ideonella sp. BN130291 TaxID=3112940 RepID=UPI002E258D52|nr:sensor histidine kinase [Ideonella sp. BN130291]